MNSIVFFFENKMRTNSLLSHSPLDRVATFRPGCFACGFVGSNVEK